MTDQATTTPTAPASEPLDKLSNLAQACLEVHKSSADHKEAQKNFRALIQQAYLLGGGKALDPKVVNRPLQQAPRVTSAATFTPRDPGKTAPAKVAAKPADPKKVTHDTGKGSPAAKNAGKDAKAEPTPQSAKDAVETF